LGTNLGKAVLVIGIAVIQLMAYPVGALGDELDDDVPVIEVSDPFEPINRGVFWFNERLDRNVIGPLADGYLSVMPEEGQVRVSSFFDNLRSPSYVVSDLAKLDFERLSIDSARFLINSTLGFLGFFDVAADLGLGRERTDFGVALGTWGIPAGPYVVLPILGSSSLRDAVGEAVDFFLDPIALVQYSGASKQFRDVGSYGAGTFRTVSIRARRAEDIETAREASLDYYLFMQSAFAQYRDGLITHHKSKQLLHFDAGDQSK
jgi:phospholipid-binding lipoprotein MlaA